MKFFIFSIVLHIFIFIFGFSLDSNKSFEINNIGNDFSAPSISVNFNSMQITPQPQPTESSDEILREVIKKENKKDSKPKKVLEKKKNESAKKSKQSENINTPTNTNTDLIELSQGVFAAKNQGVQGLKYSFISQPDPEYPLAAKRVSYTKEVSIKVRFLVGLNGEIEDIKFYNNKDSLGFQKEVEKTLNKWKLTPVTLNNKPIKLYFYKEFKFNQK